jgi:FkbM family methyltransferase
MIGTVAMAVSRTPGGVIIDIGANIGLNSIMFSKYTDVHAFEPVFYDILSDNVKGLPVHVYPFALSNCKGSKDIFIEDAIGAASFHTTGTVSKVVDMECLDDIVHDPVSFMKIDVENHEYEVLQGAKELIMKNKPVICVETFGDPERLLKLVGYTQLFTFPESNYVMMP